MTILKRIAPILPVNDLDRAMDHYRRLGFQIRPYAAGGYAIASRDGIEIHLGVPSRNHSTTSPCSAYLFVDDADDLAAEWRSAAAELHPPEDTDWGQHEGALVDTEGNVIRFGSPIQKP